MKESLLITFLFAMNSILPVRAQESRFSFADEFGVALDEFTAGPRVNYMQGKDGFIGLAFNAGWHETGYVPMKHFGFAIGSDFKLSRDFLMAPKVVLEYRYYIGIVRAGYMCYTDFAGRADNRLSAEVGLSLFSIAEISYIHTFGSSANPFNLGNDYFNLTISIPVIMKSF